MTRTFTGYHLLGCCLAFFGVVLGVNMVMAVAASRTFGGTVVDNSYIASQRFNGWLDQAKAESRLGWRADVARQNGHVVLTLSDPQGALIRADVTGQALHPLGRQADVPLRFTPTGSGQFRSAQTLPPGRWQLRLEIRNGADRARILKDIPA